MNKAWWGRRIVVILPTVLVFAFIILHVNPLVLSPVTTPLSSTVAATVDRASRVLNQSAVTSSSTNATSNALKVNKDVAFFVNVLDSDGKLGPAPIRKKSGNNSFLDIDPGEEVKGAASRIPRIIHQFWDAPGVPVAFQDNIKSWVEHHPDWEYWFWQAPDVRQLLTSCFSDADLHLYKTYPHTVNRADAMRYYVLFTFGGLYADLDVRALKPHEKLLGNAPCVLTEETYEHSVLLYNNLRYPNLINAYMAARPRHPLFARATRNLPASKTIRDDLRRTGPFYLNHEYKLYNASRNEGKQWQRQADGVKVIPPRYVMPTYDKPLQEGSLKRKCMPHITRTKPQFYRDVCREFERKRGKNLPYPDSYANHLWTHTYIQERKWKGGKSIPIKYIVPKAVNISERIVQVCGSR